MTIAIGCIIALAVIWITATIWNDIRITRLTDEVRRRFSHATGTAARLEGNQSQLRSRLLRQREDIAVLERKVVGLEGRELRRIFAERLADGTFHHARPDKRKRISTPKRRTRGR